MTDLEREDVATGCVLRWGDGSRSLLCTGRRLVLREGRAEREVSSHPWGAVLVIGTVRQGSGQVVVVDTAEGPVRVTEALPARVAESLVAELQHWRARSRSRSPMSAQRVLSVAAGLPPLPPPRAHRARPPEADQRTVPFVSPEPAAADATPAVIGTLDGETLLVRSMAAPSPLPAMLATSLLGFGAFAALSIGVAGTAEILGLPAQLGLPVGTLALGMLLFLALFGTGVLLVMTLLELGQRERRERVAIGIGARGIRHPGGRIAWDDVRAVELRAMPRRRPFDLHEARIVILTPDGELELLGPTPLSDAEFVQARILAARPDTAAPDPDQAAALADLVALRDGIDAGRV